MTEANEIYIGFLYRRQWNILAENNSGHTDSAKMKRTGCSNCHRCIFQLFG